MSATPTPEAISTMTPAEAAAALAERSAAYKNATPAGAEQQVEKLSADPKWRERYLSGGVKERREMETALTAKLSGGDHLDQVIAGTAPLPEFETVTGGELSTYKQMLAAAGLRELGISPEATRQLIENRKVTRVEYDAVMRLRDDLLGSADWVARYLKHDREAVKQMTLINIVKVVGYVDAAA